MMCLRLQNPNSDMKMLLIVIRVEVQPLDRAKIIKVIEVLIRAQVCLSYNSKASKISKL
jgi:hypothetical protein